MYFKVTVRHPTVHVGEKCRDIQMMLRKKGLINCSIQPPKKFYYLVVPFRCKSKLLFWLCKSCAIEQDVTKECTNVTITQKALAGTWVMEEVRLDVQKI